MILLLRTTRCLVIIAIVSFASAADAPASATRQSGHEIIVSPSVSDAAALRALKRRWSGCVRLITTQLRFACPLNPDSRRIHGRNGRIALTLDLIDFLRDDELCAVVAHEIGHLICDEAHANDWLFALRGEHGLAEEEAADANARTVLRVAGLSEVVLTRVLLKIRDAKQTRAPLRQQLAARIRA